MKYIILLLIVSLFFTSCASAYYHSDARIGKTENIRAFLKKNPHLVDKPDHFGNTALMISIENQKIETAKALIELGAHVNYEKKNSQSPLRLAISKNDIEMVQLLINSGADVNQANTHGWVPLMSAASRGYLALVKLLVDSGADVYAKTKKEFTASALALEKKHTHVYEYLSSLMTIRDYSRDTEPQKSSEN